MSKVTHIITKTHDNKDWTPRQAIEDLASDPILDRVDKLVCIMLVKKDNGAWSLSFQLAGVSRLEELGVLQLALNNAITDMKS